MSTAFYPEFQRPPAPGVLPEAARLDAFESGYRQGWEDALRDAVETRDRVGKDLAGRIQDLSFTYQEARAAIRREVSEAVEAIADTILPRLASEGFAPLLLQIVSDAVEGHSSPAVELHVAPKDAPALRPLLDVPGALPMTLVADESLSPGQAQFAFGEGERLADLSGLADAAADALRAHLAPPGPDEVQDRA